MRAVLSLASILAFSACAQAAPPGAGPSAPVMPPLSASDTIEMCLYRERGEGDPGQCVLEYSGNCIALAGELPTAAHRLPCYQAEMQAWDERMEAGLARLAPAMSVERRALLQQSQTAWSEAMQLDCAYMASFHSHEPLAEAQAAECQTRRTAERALLLTQWVQAYTR
ncbi:MAG: hypothetical protein CMF75_07155 [Maricaulis sp.]|nr:hypothetical protein [Maricaulis sp.]